MDLAVLAREFQTVKEHRKDYVVETTALKAVPSQAGMMLEIKELGTYEPTGIFHEQVSEKAKIPLDFYRRLQERNTNVLCSVVNEFLPDKEVRMVRALDFGEGKKYARALVSPRFRALDNYDLLLNALQCFKQYQDSGHKLTISQSFADDTNFYLKAITDQRAEVKVGDIVEGGIIIRNSEVGRGALRVEPYVNRLVCNNGAVVGTYRRFHLGRDNGKELGDQSIWSDITNTQRDELVWSEVSDIVKATLDGKFFDEYVQKAKALTEKTYQKPMEVLNHQLGTWKFSKEEADAILNSFVNGGDSSAWGIVNAMTSIAKTAETVARQVEIEELGYKASLQLLDLRQAKIEDIDLTGGEQ